MTGVIILKKHYFVREGYRGAFRHYRFYLSLCGWQGRHVPSTRRWSKVTCKRCLQKKGKEVN